MDNQMDVINGTAHPKIKFCHCLLTLMLLHMLVLLLWKETIS